MIYLRNKTHLSFKLKAEAEHCREETVRNGQCDNCESSTTLLLA